MDFVIWLQHVMVHAVPALWRLHRVHHADLDYDLTTRDQLRAGHQGMTIGIHKYREPREVSWLPGLLALPFRGRITGHAINRRQWPAGEATGE